MTEVMLSEIARPPTNELLGCRESYALTAGLALGMIALGRGPDAAGLADLRIEDRLGIYIHGQGSTHLVGGGAAVYNACGELRPDRGGARLSSLAARCYRIREGPGVNVDVTAAGAVLALGLIFAKSGNSAVAAQLGVPRTAHALHSVRPDLILLRVVARNLILWDTVRPTADWLESQLTLSLAEAAVAPAGGRAAAQTLTLARANSRAGACLALGLRFAGSASAPTTELLLAQVRHFAAARTALAAAAAAASAPATKAELPTAEACLGTAAVAVACVMAGTGDLRVLRLLRVLRRRADLDVSYGFHMAISMAIGLLFLGGGRLTLGTSKPALAALVTALFPRFPLTPTDSRYHLQAFRHLYVLSAEVSALERPHMRRARGAHGGWGGLITAQRWDVISGAAGQIGSHVPWQCLPPTDDCGCHTCGMEGGARTWRSQKHPACASCACAPLASHAGPSRLHAPVAARHRATLPRPPSSYFHRPGASRQWTWTRASRQWCRFALYYGAPSGTPAGNSPASRPANCGA